MKVKMLEHYQDADQHLQPEQVAEVGAELGAWLVEHRKAVKVDEPKKDKHLEVEPQFEQAEDPPHYGAQAEPEPRDDEKKSPMFRKPKRSRGAK